MHFRSRYPTGARAEVVPDRLGEVRRREEGLIAKTLAAVKDRLTKEVNYWDHQAAPLKDQELAGRVNAKLNSGLARQRADELAARLQKRTAELERRLFAMVDPSRWKQGSFHHRARPGRRKDAVYRTDTLGQLTPQLPSRIPDHAGRHAFRSGQGTRTNDGARTFGGGSTGPV